MNALASGVVVGVLSAATIIANHYGYAALAAFFNDPATASLATTFLGAGMAIVGGAMTGIRSDASSAGKGGGRTLVGLAVAALVCAGLGSPRAHASPVSALARYTDKDLAAAIDLANKAAPPDVAGAACFTTIRDGLARIGSGTPLTFHLASDAEKLWLLRLALLAIKNDTNCQAVCNRFSIIAPLVSRVTPTFCGALDFVK